MSQGGINAPSMGIELATMSQLAVSLANCTVNNFGKVSKISVSCVPSQL